MKPIIRVRFAKKIKLFLHNELVRFAALATFCVFTAATVSFLLEKDVPKTQINSFGDALWLSVVTFTTTGYGDKIPVTAAGRFTMAFLMLGGIVLAGILTGQIAGVLIQRNLQRLRGFINMEKKKNHFIICGWKKDMDKVIEQILIRNKELTAEDIVVIAHLPEDQLMNIKQSTAFKSIDIINGDYFAESVLRRANVQNAAKVLILADDNKSVSTTEIDSRTVMTAMTIESISKDTYVVAELIDRKYEPYLRMARVDEIILSREYGRSLIANACLSAGVAHVVFDLLDVHSGAMVTTKEIPASFIGQKFSTLSLHFRENEQSILIGVLENTGNVFKMKRDAIKEAQKNADISKIVSQLKETKVIKSNQPVLNPADDYLIRKNSSAVLIESVKSA